MLKAQGITTEANMYLSVIIYFSTKWNSKRGYIDIDSYVIIVWTPKCQTYFGFILIVLHEIIMAFFFFIIINYTIREMLN